MRFLGPRLRPRPCPTALLVAGTLLWFVPAAAASPPKGGIYGGETSQVVPGTATRFPVVIELSRSARRVNLVLVAEELHCSSGRVRREVAAFVKADVRRDGSFRARFRQALPRADGSTEAVEGSLSGRLGATRASGRTRTTLTARDPAGKVTDRCETGRVRLTGRHGRVFGGETAQGAPLRIELARTGGRIDSFLIYWTTASPCQASGAFATSTQISGTKVSRSGRFEARGSYSYTQPNGFVVSIRYSLQGRVRGSRVTGSYRASQSARSANGETVVEGCDSGPLAFSARR